MASAAKGNPTTQSPEQGLDAHGTIDGSKKQIELMYRKFAEWEKLVTESAEKMKAGRRFSHQELSRVFPETYRGIWNAEHLQAMGEPAGYDLARKFTLLRNAFFIFSPGLAQFQRNELAKLQKETPKRRQMLAKTQQLVAEGKLAEAERQIQAFHLKQLTSVFYLTSAQLKPFENEVNPPHNAIRKKLNEQRRETYREKAKTKIDSYRAAIEKLETESMRLSSELQRSATVAIADGKTGDAADAIAYVGSLWGNASAAITRSFALTLAFQPGRTESISSSFEKERGRTEEIAVKAFGNIVKSAATSTPANKIPALFPRVLSELSVIDRRSAGRLAGTFAPLAETLAEKNPGLAAQSKRYSEATLEPNRWMQRYTKQKVDNQLREYPVAITLLNRKMKPDSTVRPAIYRQQSPRERLLTPGVFTEPAGWMADDAKMLVGMKTALGASVRLSPSAKTAIVPLDGRHYASLAATIPVGKYADEVIECLLLDDSHGPLDLKAADARSSAELQEFQHTGGQIERLTLESAVARLATLPDAAHVLVPLNSLPVVEGGGSAVEKTMWRIDLQPKWVAHRLFFAETP
jgi:hypothetical protein